MPIKVWDEITYPSANFNSATTEVCSLFKDPSFKDWVLTHEIN